MENRLLLSIVIGVIFTCLFSLMFVLTPKIQKLIHKSAQAKKFDVHFIFEINDKAAGGAYPNQYFLKKGIEELKTRANHFTRQNSVHSTNDHKISVQLYNVWRSDSFIVVNVFDPHLSIGFYETYAINEIEPFLKALHKSERIEAYKRNLTDSIIFFSQPSMMSGSIFFPVELGQARIRDSAIVRHLLSNDSVQKFVPNNTILLFGNMIGSPSFFSIYAVKTNAGPEETILTGNDIEDVRQDYTNSGDVEVRIKFNRKGGRKWGNITGHNVGKSIAIVINNVVITAPRVSAKIVEGNASLAGRFTVEEAQTIALELNAGRFTFPLSLVQKEFKQIRPSFLNTHRDIIAIILCFILFTAIAYFILPLVLPPTNAKS